MNLAAVLSRIPCNLVPARLNCGMNLEGPLLRYRIRWKKKCRMLQ
jgi:hypothetical protein